MSIRPLRLKPGADLRLELERLVQRDPALAGFVVAGVGSIGAATLRFADAAAASVLPGPHELLSLSGSISASGAHLHASVATAAGEVFGGHLCHGNVVRTTAEVLIRHTPGWTLAREADSQTGFSELVVRAAAGGPGSPVALEAADVAPRIKPSNYPEPFRSMMTGRVKRVLGEPFGLVNFGVNLTELAPGAMSALRHSHRVQDEFVYVLSGCLVLETNDGRTELRPGMCAGFKAGTGNGHRLLNESSLAAVYLEVGDRTEGDVVEYADADLVACAQDGAWVFFHKNGDPYA